MSLIASLPEIDASASSVFVKHERFEKLIPYHSHTKGQLSYVEGGLAYLEVEDKKYVIPAKHYFWVPKDLTHVLKVGHSGTVLRSLFFYTHDDDSHPFYSEVGIYPINALLLEMIKHSESWYGSINPEQKEFVFLSVIKNILPEISRKRLPIALPFSENQRIKPILDYLSNTISESHSLQNISYRFGLSERSVSRLFQQQLSISFLQYVKFLRMTKAIELMLQTDLSMNQIGYEVGYSSLSAFSEAFMQVTNFRPSEFKKNF